MTPPPANAFESLGALMQLIRILRGANGCPWDKQQTPRSIVRYLTEEIYELVEAVESGNPDQIREELGDVLFHIFVIAEMFDEKGLFDIGEVARGNTEKMTRRHPHVFGGDHLENPSTIRQRWHQIKQSEKGGDQESSVLDSVPVQLPALMRAYRISERAARSGFDWSDISGVMAKAEEEWGEFKTALKKNANEQASMEFGDILFTLANIARFAGIHPETALTGAVKKFEKRFRKLEKRVAGIGATLDSRSQPELDRIWEEIKAAEIQKPDH